MGPIAIVMGSVRAGRVCPQVAGWVQELAVGMRTELIDLATWPLPMDDEPGLPVDGQYVKEHTRAWSQKIAGCSGYIFVSPQYNGGYPAPLKNALDHLFHEWSDKPALLITYGFHGGERCAAQLVPVLKRFGMLLLDAQPQLVIAPEMSGPDGQLRDPKGSFQSMQSDVEAALATMKKMLPGA